MGFSGAWELVCFFTRTYHFDKNYMESEIWERLAFYLVTASVWVKGAGEAMKQCLIIASWTMVAPGPGVASDVCPFNKLYLAVKMSSMCGVCQFHRGIKAIFRNASNPVRYFCLTFKGIYSGSFFFPSRERKSV